MNNLNKIHEEKLEFFKNKENIIKEKIEELELLKKNENYFDHFMSFKIKNLENEIEEIQNENEIEYLSRFSLIFQQKEIDNQICDVKGGVLDFVRIESSDNKKKVLETYFDKINNGIEVNNINEEEYYYTCGNCNSDSIILDDTESSLICRDCGISKTFLNPDTQQWSDTVTYISKFAYERIKHFKDKLDQVQGRGTKLIPGKVKSAILVELRKRRIDDPKNINRNLVLKILKYLKYSSYYDCVNRIVYIIGGPPPPKLGKNLESRLKEMFKYIQNPFEIYKGNRKNFLSYPYVINKFLYIIQDEYKNNNALRFIEFFPLLKSNEKLKEQDKIWKNICRDAGWLFVPSL